MVIITCKPSIPLQLRQKLAHFFFFYSSCCMDFAGLCCPVTSNSNLSGKERQIRVWMVPCFFSFCQLNPSAPCWRAVWLCCDWEGCKKCSKHQILFCTSLPALNQGGQVGLVETGVQHCEPCCKMTFKWQCLMFLLDLMHLWAFFLQGSSFFFFFFSMQSFHCHQNHLCAVTETHCFENLRNSKVFA